MIVRKTDEVESKDVGTVLGGSEMGIKIQWLIHNGVGDNSYRHNFALRRFVLEPGKSYPLHHHKYVEGVYILSGKGYFENEKERIEVEAGDVIYTASDEPHGLGAIGEEPFSLICCIDCIDGGENCSTESKAVKVS
ncbi:MAG: cupin domain-containing protein [Deltaproteobacteria bacterium]|nr:cupin domain-containing protein [Deltaproteobacteria bacterium]